MLRYLIYLMVCSICSQTLLAQDTPEISFKKINSQKQISFKLPLKCRLYTSKDDKTVGKISSYTDSTILFEFKDYDTSEVSKIMAIDSLTRKQKYDLIDTLIQDSKYVKEICQDSIYKISILSGSDNLGRELSLLGSSLLIMGSAAALLYDLSTNVGSKFEWWYWLEITGITTGMTGVVFLMKRDILFSKWRLST